MNGSTPIDSELLARYLAGEADDSQRRTVEDWAVATEANARELDRMRTLWDLGGGAGPVPDLDVGAAWRELDGRIADEEGRGRVIPIGRPLQLLRWVAVAAVFTGLVLAARWFLQPATQQFLATTTVVEAILADSSAVVLAPGTTLEARMGRERRVKLRGIAYFEVRRDMTRPFTVETGEVQVTVLGTAFEVSAADTADAVLVRVCGGRVSVVAGADTLVLAAGQHARFDRKRHQLERRPAPPSEVWGLRVLQFEGATLRQVAEQLERIYPVRIDLRNEAIASCTLTALFDDETIGAILRVIADTFDLEVEQQGADHFTLDGDGC